MTNPLRQQGTRLGQTCRTLQLIFRAAPNAAPSVSIWFTSAVWRAWVLLFFFVIDIWLLVRVGAEQLQQERPESTPVVPSASTTPPRGSSPTREEFPTRESSPARGSSPVREESPARDGTS